MNKRYNVGIYARLSKDDASNSAKSYIPSDGSASIENQKELLVQFAMFNGWSIKNTYVDDGYGGGNFNRPGFIRMMEDVRAGEINLILCKDLSRIGRDYVEVGRYTDDIFPSLKCRFIALIDGIDTAQENDMLHFRSLMNDYHLKDLSIKTKSALYAKAKDGQYLGSIVTYGYEKDINDRHKLVIDEYSSGIVRKIYDMRIDGMSYNKITAYLNNERIMTPFVYWHSKHGKNECTRSNVWRTNYVKRILDNEFYTGVLIQNYTGSRSYKEKTMIYKPESEWIRHENNHEAIVSKEEWELVKHMAQTAKSAYRGGQPSAKLFSGKLVCSDCSTNLVSMTGSNKSKSGEVRKYVYYVCATHSLSGRSVCTSHRIAESVLKDLVMTDILKHSEQIKTDEHALRCRMEKLLLACDNQKDMKVEISRLQKRVDELDRITAELYEGKVVGKLSEDSFLSLTAKNRDEREQKSHTQGKIIK